MKSILSVSIAVKLVVGSPIVFVLPTEKGTNRKQSGTKNVDFGRNVLARHKKHRDLLSDKTGKLSRRQLDTSKINHTPKKATKFQDTDVTGLLDFDNPLEDIFTSRVHIKNLARHLGKSSKSKSESTGESTPSWGAWQSPDIPSPWHDGKSSKSKSEKSASSPVWNGWHASNGHEGKSSKSKSKSKSSTWNGWQASHDHGGKSSKSKSKSWGGWHTSSSASKSSKVHAYKSSTSFDFSYQITYESWSLDEERDTTLPGEETSSPVASPTSVNKRPELHEHVEPKPREETTFFSETEVRCAGDFSKLIKPVTIQYYYKVEAMTSNTTFLKTIEAHLLQKIAHSVMSCDKEERDRSLAEEGISNSNVLAVSSDPKDKVVSEDSCSPDSSASHCFIVQGATSFTAQAEHLNIEHLLTVIKDSFAPSLKVDDVVRVLFLGKSLEPNSVSIFDVSSATKPRTTDKEEGKNNQMYYVAAAASFGGLVAFFAAVFLKRRGVRSHDTHMKLNDEATSTEATLSSDESQSHNHTTAPSETDETCEWSQPDAWLATNMK